MMNSISNFVVAGGFSFGLVTEKFRPDERKKFLVMTVEEVKGVGGGGRRGGEWRGGKTVFGVSQLGGGADELTL